jgi:hypothetical protein
MTNSIKKTVFFFFIVLLFSQCGIFGSRKTISARAAQPIKKVALILVAENDPFLQNSTDAYRALFIKSLAESFASQKEFDFMIMDKEYVIPANDDMEKSLIGVEMKDYDAYILCYRKIQSGFNHKVWFEVFETNPVKHLVTTSHSTRMGNSYFMPPGPYETLIDATKGAFDILMTNWNKISS